MRFSTIAAIGVAVSVAHGSTIPVKREDLTTEFSSDEAAFLNAEASEGEVAERLAQDQAEEVFEAQETARIQAAREGKSRADQDRAAAAAHDSLTCQHKLIREGQTVDSGNIQACQIGGGLAEGAQVAGQVAGEVLSHNTGGICIIA